MEIVPVTKKSKREIYPVAFASSQDYMDNDVRRIFPKKGVHSYENLIFEDTVALCLTDTTIKINIKNCEFNKGLYVRRVCEGDDRPYSIFMFLSDVHGNLTLNSWDEESDISIDTCSINDFFSSGPSSQLNIYKSDFQKIEVQEKITKLFIFTNSSYNKIKLHNFYPEKVEIDSKYIAVKNWNVFCADDSVKLRQLSENYHRITLKAVKTISESRAVNYQLNKATMSKICWLFGYFHRPFFIVLVMASIALIFSVIYKLLIPGKTYLEYLYFSTYTFLTIGYGDLGTDAPTIPKIALVFVEGVLGVLFSAVLLTSIINTTQKK